MATGSSALVPLPDGTLSAPAWFLRPSLHNTLRSFLSSLDTQGLRTQPRQFHVLCKSHVVLPLSGTPAGHTARTPAGRWSAWDHVLVLARGDQKGMWHFQTERARAGAGQCPTLSLPLSHAELALPLIRGSPDCESSRGGRLPRVSPSSQRGSGE